MDLIAALRTGKPVRRPIAKHYGASRSEWLGNDFVRRLLTRNSAWYAEQPFNLIDETDLMSADWESKADA